MWIRNTGDRLRITKIVNKFIKKHLKKHFNFTVKSEEPMKNLKTPTASICI
jgi:hypothetical protein